MIAWLAAFLLCCAGLYIAVGCAIKKFSMVTVEYTPSAASSIEPADDKQTPEEILEEAIGGIP